MHKKLTQPAFLKLVNAGTFNTAAGARRAAGKQGFRDTDTQEAIDAYFKFFHNLDEKEANRKALMKEREKLAARLLEVEALLGLTQKSAARTTAERDRAGGCLSQTERAQMKESLSTFIWNSGAKGKNCRGVTAKEIGDGMGLKGRSHERLLKELESDGVLGSRGACRGRRYFRLLKTSARTAPPQVERRNGVTSLSEAVVDGPLADAEKISPPRHGIPD